MIQMEFNPIKIHLFDEIKYKYLYILHKWVHCNDTLMHDHHKQDIILPAAGAQGPSSS